MHRLRAAFGLLFFVLAAFLPASLPVSATNEAVQSHSRASIISEVSSFKPGVPFWVAIQFNPDQGWHSYWLNPGDSGAAPVLTWQDRQDIRIETALFPVPERMPAGPLMNYGYERPSSLLVQMTVAEDFQGSDLPLELDLEWLVCEIECVPQSGHLSLAIEKGDGALDPEARVLFQKARSELADPVIWDSRLEYDANESRLLVLMDAAETVLINNAYFFPLAEGVTDYAADQKFSTVAEGLTIQLPRYEGAPTPQLGAGILVLQQKNGDRLAVTIEAKLQKAASASETAAFSLPLWQAALFALIGGMILNLMPCVFPVLSLKAFSLVHAGSLDKKARHVEGWAYTAGILSSFGLIVLALVLLRAGGAAIGWGFQLQEPLFVAGLIVIMFAVGLSLSGLFNIQTGLEGSGQSLTQKGGAKGAFFTGVLATLVATPCTAPFMAPAIGYALGQPAYVIFTVFFMLGFGLALPFLALSYSEGIARHMPRPGPWMDKLKQGLAFPMYATSVWLMSVFMVQAGDFSLIILLAGLVFMTFALWLYQQVSSKFWRIFAVLFALLSLGLTAQLINENASSEAGNSGKSHSKLGAAPYSETALQALLATGKPVFVYFSADWCITCKVNERVALFREDTKALFKEKDVQVMKGDWTNRNKEIADILARHNRAGVPLYLYYPAGAADPIVLPEILTPAIIAETLTL